MTDLIKFFWFIGLLLLVFIVSFAAWLVMKKDYLENKEKDMREVDKKYKDS